MAKVTGPLFSLAAHGTYLDSLVFITRAGGTHVSKPVQQVGPRSVGQLQVTQKVSDLSSAWSALSGAVKDDWIACGITFSLSGYHLWWREWFSQGSSPGTPPVIPCP